MMQVEEKPDVAYSDIGRCTGQIEKLREIVKTPPVSVSLHMFLLPYRMLTSRLYSVCVVSPMCMAGRIGRQWASIPVAQGPYQFRLRITSISLPCRLCLLPVAGVLRIGAK
jgi:hypothetical protein